MRIHHSLIYVGAGLFAAACTAGGEPSSGPDAGGIDEGEPGSGDSDGAYESSAEDWNFEEESMEGNLRVLLTDAPTDLEEVWVTVSSVEILEGEPEGDEGGEDGDRGGEDGDRGGEDGDRGGEDGDRGGEDGDRGGEDGDRGDDEGGGEGGDGMGPADADEEGEDGNEGASWGLLTDEPQEFELLALQDGVTDILADADLPEGHYGQIRLVVESAEVVYEDGESEELFIPSGEQRGIQINLGLDVEEDRDYGVVLDFDAHESIVDNPEGLIMRPVIQVEYAGPIEGDGDENGDGDEEGGDGEGGDGEGGDEDDGDGEESGDGGDDEGGDDEGGDDEGGDGEG